jgi:hypothetical protein
MQKELGCKQLEFFCARYAKNNNLLDTRLNYYFGNGFPVDCENVHEFIKNNNESNSTVKFEVDPNVPKICNIKSESSHNKVVVHRLC